MIHQHTQKKKISCSVKWIQANLSWCCTKDIFLFILAMGIIVVAYFESWFQNKSKVKLYMWLVSLPAV